MLIWWTSKQDCKEIELTAEAPAYLKKQFAARRSAKNSGRLYVDDRALQAISPGQVQDTQGCPISKWPDSPWVAELKEQCGIPIYEKDIDWVVNLPGMITDVCMRKLEFV